MNWLIAGTRETVWRKWLEIVADSYNWANCASCWLVCRERWQNVYQWGRRSRVRPVCYALRALRAFHVRIESVKAWVTPTPKAVFFPLTCLGLSLAGPERVGTGHITVCLTCRQSGKDLKP